MLGTLLAIATCCTGAWAVKHASWPGAIWARGLELPWPGSFVYQFGVSLTLDVLILWTAFVLFQLAMGDMRESGIRRFLLIALPVLILARVANDLFWTAFVTHPIPELKYFAQWLPLFAGLARMVTVADVKIAKV